MKKETSTIINCHYRINNEIKFFCTITYRNGISFILETPSEINLDAFMKNDCFVCFDGQNKQYILQKLEDKTDNRGFSNIYYFQSLIKLSHNKNDIEDIKIKSLNFTFPNINSFFYNCDYLSATTLENDGVQEQVLLRKTNLCFKPFTINRKFRFNLNIGYNYGGGIIGGDGGHFDLIKSINISSKIFRPLDEFIEIVKLIIEFFSICYRQKLLITEIWSDRKENSTNEKLEIETFQFYILNKNYSDKRTPFKNIATYQLLSDNFDSILKNFIKSKKKPYESFPVFCDLYMRVNDSPVEIHPQMNFLPLMQGIEAYVSKLSCNNGVKLTNKWKSAIRKFKKENPSLPNIKELKYDNQLTLQKKINNTIKFYKIENIIKFKMTNGGKYKLINQIVAIRNYYTHFGEQTKISDEDFYSAIDYTKILCEILIMKELGFSENQIKISLHNNYYYLEKWDNKYCSLNSTQLPRGYSQKDYLGDFEEYKENRIFKYYLFYKMSKEQNIKLIKKCLNKDLRKNAESIIVDKNLVGDCYDKLDKIFKICYDRYKTEQEQIQYRHNII